MNNESTIKIGGSLFDLPDLGRRLRAWLQHTPTQQVLLIPGGGRAADWIRDPDVHHSLGEETSHWLALRVLSFTAHILAALLPDSRVIEDLADRKLVWKCGQTPILDLHAFARADDGHPDHLAHSWAVTSDALAARVAVVAGIPELVLLKSRSLPEPIDWSEAACAGFVDAALPGVLASAPTPLRVTAVNFRTWRPSPANAPAPPAPAP